MAILEEDRKRIEEEEEIREKVRLKFEKKSSGIAGVLSTACPGLGQIYNGQMGKATLLASIVLIGLILLSAGAYFQIKGIPVKGQSIVHSESFDTIEMTEEGMIVETAGKSGVYGVAAEKQPMTPVILMIAGTLVMLVGWNYSIKDAIKSAKQINRSY